MSQRRLVADADPRLTRNNHSPLTTAKAEVNGAL
jgi:hypothetical protein